MKRYSIWVREHGSDHDVELIVQDSNPAATVKGLHAKDLKLGKGKKTPKYDFVYVIDHGEQP